MNTDILYFIYTSFGKKYGSLLELYNNSCFVYIEELLTNENLPFDLQSTVNYSDPAYKDHLKKLVDLISKGLISMNIPEDSVTIYFKNHYKEIPANPNLQTYVDWIVEEFQPKIQKILFRELLKYLIKMDSAIPLLQSQGFFGKELIERLNQIRDHELELNTFIYWYFKLSETIIQKCQESSIAPDLYGLLKFEEPERDLQAFFLGFEISQELGLTHIMRFDELLHFLQTRKEWLEQGITINEKYPFTLFCGVKIAQAYGIELDIESIKEVLKNILVKVVNNFSAPVFQQTFLVDYIIDATKILGLKLTNKLIQGLLRTDEASISYDNLKLLSTIRLATIYLIYEKLDSFSRLDKEVRKNILKIIDSRKKEDLFFNTDLDFIASNSAIYGAFTIYRMENILSRFPIHQTTQYITGMLEDNILLFDFGLTSQLAEILFGIRYLHGLLEYLYTYQVKGYSVFPLIGTDELEIEGGETTDHSQEMIFEEPTSAESSTISETQPETSPIDEDLETYEEARSVKTVGTVPVGPNEGLAQGSVQRPSSSIQTYSRPLPSQFWDFFGNFPSLNPDVAEELDINFEGLAKPHPVIFEDISLLHQWIVCLRALNIDIPYSADYIYDQTSKFRMKNGFTRGDLQGEQRYPDPQNTFYGLAIYSEMGLMNKLDLGAIHRYLLDEVENVNINAFLTNNYIFNSLRILERFGYSMSDYSSLIPRILEVDFEKMTDQFDLVEDIIHILALIQSINPNYDVSNFADDYYTNIQLSHEEDGSINGVVVDTAKAFIALHIFNLQNTPEAKFALKFLQYDNKFFNEQLSEQPIGWQKDDLGYILELRMLYWTLLALTVMYPAIPSPFKATICPECFHFFRNKPHFCNRCGHKFE